MPIQFPAQRRMTVIEQNWWLKQNTKCFDAVPAPNFNQLGQPFFQNKQGMQSGYALDGGLGRSGIRAVNLRRPSTTYQDPTQTAQCNPPNLLYVLYDETSGFDRNFAEQNSRMVGVSRDVTGAPLGGVTIKLFRTADDSLVGTTISDGSGNWRFDSVSGSPFYMVEYKAGATDVFGTSPNTNTETTYQPGG
jgi:hypothetical protein